MLQPILRPLLSPIMRGVTEAGVGGFSIGSLFSASQDGAVYDPPDLSSMYQDAAGTTAAVIGQPDGLMLDKRVQGSWCDVTGAVWTKTQGDGVLSVSADGKTITVSGATTATRITRTGGDFPFVPGMARMRITATYTSATAVEVWLRGAPVALSSGVAVTIVNKLNNSTLERLDVGTGTVVFTISELSFWKGNHASQTTSSLKPTVQAGHITLDRFDDYMTAATGGGGTTGILLCAGIRAGGAGSARTIWSDRGTNTGYRLSVNASNQLVLSAGNGAAYTEVLGPTITAGTDYVVMGWHDGANLRVRVGLGSATSAAFATATAGAAGFTLGRDNGVAAGYYGDRIYGLVYRKNDASTAAERDNVTRYMARKSNVTL